MLHLLAFLVLACVSLSLIPPLPMTNAMLALGGACLRAVAGGLKLALVGGSVIYVIFSWRGTVSPVSTWQLVVLAMVTSLTVSLTGGYNAELNSDAMLITWQ